MLTIPSTLAPRPPLGWQSSATSSRFRLSFQTERRDIVGRRFQAYTCRPKVLLMEQ